MSRLWVDKKVRGCTKQECLTALVVGTRFEESLAYIIYFVAV